MCRSFLTRFPSFCSESRVDRRDNAEEAVPVSSACGQPLVRSSSLSNALSSESSVFGPLTVYRHSAMACDFELSVNETDTAREEPFRVFDLIDEQEEELSVFRPASLVSRINALASEMDVVVPAVLFSRLLVCRRLWEETDGAFDITASTLWKLWGFAKGEGRVPTQREIDAALEKVGMNHIILNEDRQTVSFDSEGVEINFGGIGKGFALDTAEACLSDTSLIHYLIHGGMSSALARGGRSGDQCRDLNGNLRSCWTIGVADPLFPERRVASIQLCDEAVGTGGSGRQFFFHQGKRLSHIVDPKTGYPATGILSSTVITSTAAEADALSTAFFVMGPERTERFAQTHPDCGILLVLDKGGGKEEVITFNFDESRCKIQ